MEAVLDFEQGCQYLAIILFGVWERGGVSLRQLILIMWPQAVRQMRGEGRGVRGGEEGWHEADKSSQQPLFLFLLVFLSAVYPAGVR